MALQTRHAWKCAMLLEREKKRIQNTKKYIAEEEDAKRR